MLIRDLKKALRFYFITDDGPSALSPLNQVRIAVAAGATMIQYRNKGFSPRFYPEIVEIRDVCKSNRVPLIINDHILLARAVSADGVHVGQEDENPAIARVILGADAIVGVSVSTPEEFEKTDLSYCDYIGVGPVYQTGTKPDAKAVIGLSGLAAVSKLTPLPVVAIGGINEANAAACFENGADGVSLISAVSRAKDPEKAAQNLARICGCSPRDKILAPWEDEFGLIDKLIHGKRTPGPDASNLIVPPGDDTALLKGISRPIITTDAHREAIHFSFAWQTPFEVGQKAVEITLSDLAAAYARPICIFINLGLPSHVSDALVQELYDGIYAALDRHGCELGGGNISGADAVSLDLFAVGQGREDLFPARSNAGSGYGLYCTGPLGMARAGLKALMKRDFSHGKLIDKFKFPRARFDAAVILAENGVDCVMDISDGLSGDAAHIAKASGISIRLEMAAGHLDESLAAFCRQYGLNPHETALAGGEEYELLFACPPEVFQNIRKSLPGVYPVGQCLPFCGKPVINPASGASSFQHGKRKTGE
jgi:thiamine-monophosphate kinase